MRFKFGGDLSFLQAGVWTVLCLFVPWIQRLIMNNVPLHFIFCIFKPFGIQDDSNTLVLDIHNLHG